MADIYREIEEGLRHDRLQKVWRRLRWPLLAALLAIIGAVVAYVVVRDLAEERQLEQGAQYAMALETFQSGNPSSAVELFSSLADDADEPGYVIFSRLRAAQASVAAGDTQGAVNIYDRMAGDGGIDPLYRDLATLLAADRLVDTASLEEINQRLAPLLTTENPWRPLAQEIVALTALRVGRPEEARALFLELSTGAGVPPGVRARSEQLLSSLGGSPVEPATAD